MLNRIKVAHELSLLSHQLFIDQSVEYNLAQQIWEKIAADPTFVYKAKAFKAPFPIPSWQAKLNDAIDVHYPLEKYQIVSVDGSQIYPDRHTAVSCFLINIGTVILRYGIESKPVFFDSIPYVLTENEQQELPFSTEVVNCMRHEREFTGGIVAARIARNEHPTLPTMLVFDGSLIFWHLEAKDMRLKDMFLSKYISVLHQLYAEKMVTASYMSMPKGKELINLIKIGICDADASRLDETAIVDRMVDAQVVQWFLEPYQRTIVFKNHSDISQEYPDHVHPHFFYIHVGQEIGRVEIPAWIAQDNGLVDFVAQVLLDQSIKGRGYPVALAEAHEQAVVKGPDRDFFYHLLTKLGIEHKQSIIGSRKALRKRSMGV